MLGSSSRWKKNDREEDELDTITDPEALLVTARKVITDSDRLIPMLKSMLDEAHERRLQASVVIARTQYAKQMSWMQKEMSDKEDCSKTYTRSGSRAVATENGGSLAGGLG
jgi:hypothetical protein